MFVIGWSFLAGVAVHPNEAIGGGTHQADFRLFFNGL
jgi:hypothetical protein